MRIYIAGPMTGLPEFNYPAFNDAARTLRAAGHVVHNPAENPVPPCGSWLGYMRMGLKQIADADCLVLLPGWADSRGARIEHRLAIDLGLVAYPYEISCRAGARSPAARALSQPGIHQDLSEDDVKRPQAVALREPLA
jgi:hypothetical protein